jgi:choloylglycine hydrolase
MKTKFYLALFLCLFLFSHSEIQACTGITLRTQDNLTVLARTVEWAKEDINSRYVIVPRGHNQQSYTPDGKKHGIKFAAKYGYVGLAVTQDEFVIDGINEKGLSA